jgi:hypothetical protein
MTEEGTASTGLEAYEFCTDDSSKMLFTLTRAFSYSSGEFELVCTYDSLKAYIFAGFGKIASVHNDTDDVDFYDYEGNFIKNIKIDETLDNSLQNSYGIFLGENEFILSEDGNNNVVIFDLKEGKCRKFKSFDFGWLGAICKCGDSYYIYTISETSIYKFNESTDPVLVNKGFPIHVTGIVAENDVLSLVSNYGNGFCEYDLTNKQLNKLFVLSYPDLLTKITYIENTADD